MKTLARIVITVKIVLYGVALLCYKAEVVNIVEVGGGGFATQLPTPRSTPLSSLLKLQLRVVIPSYGEQL